MAAGAPAQFRQRQMRILHAKGFEDAHRAAHGHHALFARRVGGFRGQVIVRHMKHVPLYEIVLY
jgi:hypothetical protein